MRYHLDVASPTSAALTNIHHLFHQALSLGTELMHDIEFSRAVRQPKRNMSTYLLSPVPHHVPNFCLMAILHLKIANGNLYPTL
jgi:hypothetical protein